mmetsp:Transcript_55012/g.123540  ORF Transcript_55012/g.123540 Transcript_55012/m.123540 type:complete len:183 (+) Transcript_55012:2244-2792(+)
MPAMAGADDTEVMHAMQQGASATNTAAVVESAACAVDANAQFAARPRLNPHLYSSAPPRQMGQLRRSAALSEQAQAPPPEACAPAASGSGADRTSQNADLWDHSWPSMGSIGHAAGACKPCLFSYKAGCTKGKRCLFCHIPHDPEDVKRVRPSKKSRNILQQMDTERNSVGARTRALSADSR